VRIVPVIEAIAAPLHRANHFAVRMDRKVSTAYSA
jgi:hypothetical protein